MILSWWYMLLAAVSMACSFALGLDGVYAVVFCIASRIEYLIAINGKDELR